MTREETIRETIRELEILHYNDCLMPYEVEAIDTAISLLKQKPKTGQWIYTGDHLTDGMLKCSVCGKEIDVSELCKYCCECGSYNGG